MFKYQINQKLFIKNTNTIVTIVARRFLAEDKEPMYLTEEVINNSKVKCESELTAD